LGAGGRYRGFASLCRSTGLSKLSVWQFRLSIGIERIKPSNPQQNVRHERVHLTLKQETTKPAAEKFLKQQGRFDDFIICYNTECPHQGINMKVLANLFAPLNLPYRGLPNLEYPFHDKTISPQPLISL